MTKQERFSLLRNRYYAIAGLALSNGFLPVTRSEVMKEARGIVKSYSDTTRDRAMVEMRPSSDDDEMGTHLPSSLSFDSPEMFTGERETDILLSKEEKHKVKGDLAAKGKGERTARGEESERFEGADLGAREIEPYIGFLSGVSEPNAFELAIVDQPLLLTA